MNDNTLTLNVPPDMALDTREAVEGGYNIPLDPPPRTVLDIGACWGAFTCWAAKCWPGSKVTAYEPIKENYDGLLRNVSNVDASRIECVNKAVFSESGRIALHGDDQHHTLWSSSLPLYRRNQPEITTNAVVVQAVGASELPSAEFVKIDCEGAELGILRALNLSATRALAVEIHFQDELDAITRIMTDAGFAVHDRVSGGHNAWVMKFIRRTEIKPDAKRLMFASPVYRLVPALWLNAMMAMVQSTRVPTVFRMMLGDSAVYRARNALAAEFIMSDCTHLLFVDSDVPFIPWHVERIMSLPDEYGIIGGCYPKRIADRLEWVANRLPEDIAPLPNGLQQVKYVGTGFMRITRRCLERMIEKHGTEMEYPVDAKPDRREWHLFPEGVHTFADGSKRLLSEDWAFCQRWLDMGEKVWLDTAIALQHVGEAVYPLPHQMRPMKFVNAAAAEPARIEQ